MKFKFTPIKWAGGLLFTIVSGSIYDYIKEQPLFSTLGKIFLATITVKVWMLIVAAALIIALLQSKTKLLPLLTTLKDHIDRIKSPSLIEPKFPGGDLAWNHYIDTNLENIPLKRKAPKRPYVVLLSFTVEADGSISGVIAQTNPNYGTVPEAIRLLEKSPKWIPAKDKGKAVPYNLNRAIVFNVE
jgi:hypothetical protein